MTLQHPFDSFSIEYRKPIRSVCYMLKRYGFINHTIRTYCEVRMPIV